MIRSLTHVLILGASLLAATATIASALAVVMPALDLLNHFRPLALPALAVLAALAFMLRMPIAGRIAGFTLLINVALALAPAAYGADTSARSSLRIVTFNLWVQNAQAAAVSEFLLASDADIIVLQEVDARLEAELLPRLQVRYPHVQSCAKRNCGQMLLSRQPWRAAGSADRAPGSPPIIWADFGTGRNAFTITGLHMAWPFQPQWQRAQMAWLEERYTKAQTRQILVGDFNLTPFSWGINRLCAATGLKRHAALNASWPAHRLAPLILLDNLLATPDVRAVRHMRSRDALGSDHRAMIFDIAFN